MNDDDDHDDGSCPDCGAGPSEPCDPDCGDTDDEDLYGD